MHTEASEVIDSHAAAAAAHPPYVIIYLVLLALLGASVALGHVPNVYLMNVLVFSVAIIKTILVLRYFMGLRFEPWLIALILLGAVACLVAFFVGVYPDVVMRTGWNK
jgi:caa(3)-type oxidase subunit IV